MLIRYFRINDPYRLVGLLILMILIQLPLLLDLPGMTVPELKNILLGEKLNDGNGMYISVVDNTGPLAAWFHEFTETLFGRSVLGRHIFGFLLVFLQGAFLGIMFITRKVHNENTYIPSFLFCLLFCFSFDAITISADLVGSTFLLFALNNMFKEIEFRAQPDETVLNIGLFISLASLFSFGFSVFLICAMLVLVFFTRSTPRKFSLLVFGFLLPHFLVLSISYFNNSLGKMWEYYYLSNLGFNREVFMTFKSLVVLSSVPLFYFVISVVMLQREARFSKYQSQVLQIIFLWIGFSLLYVMYAKNLRPQSLIVFIPAFAFLFTHFFLFIRRKRFIEVNTWILFLGVIAVSYLSRYHKIESVDYARLLVSAERPSTENKRILVLKNDLNLYRNNYLATPYLNWRLSEDIFRHPEFYENITEVYHHFKTDAPQEIVDPENLMAPFFQRIPELRSEYSRQGERYVKRN
jgi:hypothetical protein